MAVKTYRENYYDSERTQGYTAHRERVPDEEMVNFRVFT